MIRYGIPIIAVCLFFLEPVFGLFSPIVLHEEFYYLIPRFLLMYFIFLSIYYDTKRAVAYGLIFGLLYDVTYIDIIGLYSFLYPLMCLVAKGIVKYVHQHLIVTTVITLLLISAFEMILYGFFLLIGFQSLPFDAFISQRLIPTVIANSIFLILLGWLFKWLLSKRLLEKARQLA